MLSNAEMIAAVLGTYGAFIMVVPQFFEKYCFCCFMGKGRKVDDDYEKDEEAEKIPELN